MDARKNEAGVRLGIRPRGGERSSRRWTPRIEDMEARQLLSGVITDIVRLPADVKIGAMAVNSDGALWFAERGADGSGVTTIGRSTPGGFRSEFKLPEAQTPRSIGAMAPDGQGAMWFTATTAASPDGATPATGGVGKIDAKGTVTEYPLTSPADRPGAAVSDDEGNLWVAVSHETDGASIVKVAPDGALTEFPVEGSKSVTWLTMAKDGNLWFVDGQQIGRMTPTGDVARFDVPAPEDGTPIDLSNANISPDSEGNVWFLGLGGLNRMTPTGEVKSYPAPTTTITSLSTAADGNLWFSFLPPTSGQYSESKGSMVARMTPDGRTTVVSDRIDDAGVPVLRMVSGRDGGVWFDEGGAIVSRLSLASVPSFTPPIIRPTTPSTLTAEPGKPIDGTIVSFIPNLTGARAYAASVDWGDGTIEPATVVRNSSGGYDVRGQHTYTGDPDRWLDIQVSVKDDSGGTSLIFNRVNLKAAVPVTTPTPTPTPVPPGGPTAPAVRWRTFPNWPGRREVPQPGNPTPGPVPTNPQPNLGRPTPAGTAAPIPTTPTPTRSVAPTVNTPPAATITNPPTTLTPTPTTPTPTTPTPTTSTPGAGATTPEPKVDPWAAYRRPGLHNETIGAGRMPRTPRPGVQIVARRAMPPGGVPRGPRFMSFPQFRPGMRLPRR